MSSHDEADTRHLPLRHGTAYNGTQIVPETAAGPSGTRAAARLFLFLCITLQELARCMVVLGRRPPSLAASAQALQRWSSRLVNALGVRIRFIGERPPPGVLLVSNHRSYMDIAVIGSVTACSFLAKSEIARWPLVGTGARWFANVVFVRRESPASRKEARGAVASVLRAGGTVTVFPEGTTDAGPGLLPFRKGIFQMAAKEGFGVIPVAIAFDDPRDAWVGDDTFVGHFLRAFSKKETHVTLTLGRRLPPGDAESLRLQAWDWIDQRLRSSLREQGEGQRKAA